MIGILVENTILLTAKYLIHSHNLHLLAAYMDPLPVLYQGSRQIQRKSVGALVRHFFDNFEVLIPTCIKQASG